MLAVCKFDVDFLFGYRRRKRIFRILYRIVFTAFSGKFADGEYHRSVEGERGSFSVIEHDFERAESYVHIFKSESRKGNRKAVFFFLICRVVRFRNVVETLFIFGFNYVGSSVIRLGKRSVIENGNGKFYALLLY